MNGFHFPARWILAGIALFFLLGEVDPNSYVAFDNYFKQRETTIWQELNDAERFLWIDQLPETRRRQLYQELWAGKVVLDTHRKQKAPGGLIHHLTGVVFVPNVTLKQVLAFLQDFDRMASHFAPDLVASKLLGRNGDKFHIYQRYRKKKIVTVVIDTEHDVTFVTYGPTRAASFSYTTSVNEVEDAGTKHEKKLPAGEGSGYLRKMNNYWRYLERDGGVYVQGETLSLSRPIPLGLDWVIGGFINSVPRESLQFTLARTREHGGRMR